MDLVSKQNYSNLPVPTIKYKKGGRYIKVYREVDAEDHAKQTSVVAFVDAKEGSPEFGNIYKPAGWKAPAKGARGNVFSAQYGLEAVHPTMGTVLYLRQVKNAI